MGWREPLRRAWCETVPADYSWTRPNRRHVWSGLYLPGDHIGSVGEIATAAIQKIEKYQAGQPAAGGGGTDFRPCFEWLQGVIPQTLVFLTDLCGTFPSEAPVYPVPEVKPGAHPLD